ncbi:MAG TPA: cyclase family protein [Conexibacter sp.]|jgi:kynurenine formamidase
MSDDTRTVPTEAEVLAYFDELSNWGRWGADDVLGTLNLITPEKRVAAAGEVRDGHAISCAWDLDVHTQPEHTSGPPQRFMVTTGQGLEDEHRVLPPGLAPGDRQAGALEYIGYIFHGFSVTHLDALSHIFWDGKMYNDVPAELVSSSSGATAHDVRGTRDGVITRGVLVDAPKFRGVDWLEPGDSVTGAELEEIVASQGVEVQEGDALLLRTGYGKRKLQNGPDAVMEVGRAGWHASCLPFMHKHGVSLIGADTAQDVIPSGYPGCRIPIHSVGLVAMGLYLLDNCNFEPLAEHCAAKDRYAFQFILSAIPFVGATGSPVNPLAVF